MLIRRSIRHLHSLKFPSHNGVNIISIKTPLQTRFLPTIRYFSAKSNNDNASDIVSHSVPQESNTLSSLDGISTGISTALADSAGLVEDVTTDAVVYVAGWGPVDSIMYCIDYCHTFLNIPYWESIILVSLGVRFCLIPLAIKTAQNTARLAFIRPHLDKLQKAYAANPNAASDPRQAKQYQMDMFALYAKYKVNPLTSIALPVVQLPIFISFFTALQSMGKYYPGFSTGGDFWFTNLAVADATWILPALNGLSFLIMVEVGADGMPENEQKGYFKLAMRSMAFLIVPLTITMPQALFVYWNFNNFFSIGQALVFKTDWFREKFNVPAPPKPKDTPPLKIPNPFAKLAGLIYKKLHETSGNAKPMIVDGSESPPPSVTTRSSSGNNIIHTKVTAAATAVDATKGTTAPPVTYALPTTKRNKISSTSIKTASTSSTPSSSNGRSNSTAASKTK